MLAQEGKTYVQMEHTSFSIHNWNKLTKVWIISPCVHHPILTFFCFSFSLFLFLLDKEEMPQKSYCKTDSKQSACFYYLCFIQQKLTDSLSRWWETLLAWVVHTFIKSPLSLSSVSCGGVCMTWMCTRQLNGNAHIIWVICLCSLSVTGLKNAYILTQRWKSIVQPCICEEIWFVVMWMCIQGCFVRMYISLLLQLQKNRSLLYLLQRNKRNLLF